MIGACAYVAIHRRYQGSLSSRKPGTLRHTSIGCSLPFTTRMRSPSWSSYSISVCRRPGSVTTPVIKSFNRWRILKTIGPGRQRVRRTGTRPSRCDGPPQPYTGKY
jgi:hypothetical protein